MRALVLEQDKQLKLHQDWRIPNPAGHGVLVHVAACGICGSDLHRGFGGGAYHYPLVMGHEFSGVVAEAHAGSSFKNGERVAIFPLLPCKKCKPCQTGDFAQCTDYNYFGSRCDGGMGEYVRVPEENLFRIPDRVKTLHASMVEPAAVALHGVRKFQIRAGDTAVVIGAGPIGNMTAQWLRIHGCRKVILTDVDELKLAVASRMGFETIDSKKTDPVKAILDRTEGEGAQRVIEACGLPITFLQATQMAARFGEVVFMGNIHGTFQIGEKDFSSILRKELKIHGTWNSKVVPRGEDDWSTVLKYMDAELQVAPLITDTPALEEGPDIFESILKKKRYHNKVIFKITE